MEGGNGVLAGIFPGCFKGNSDEELVLETTGSTQWFTAMPAELLMGDSPHLETLLFGTVDENS